jgi:thioredoxin reductase
MVANRASGVDAGCMDAYDVVVVGGGAAGLSAALVLARARRRVAVLDAGAPRNAPAAHMHGYLSRDGMSPRDLLTVGRAEVRGYGGALIDASAVRVAPSGTGNGEGFEVRSGDGSTLAGRRVVIATGLHDVLPDVAGLWERWGHDVLHCPYCHGYEVRDQPLGVLGGSPESVQHALLVAQWSSDVVYFPHSHQLTADERERLVARSVEVVEGVVRSVATDADALCGLEMADGRVVHRSAVFVRPRFVPNADLLVGLGGAVDDDGWPVIDAVGRTSVAGVWVAGNVGNPRAQVITAAGEGSATALAVNADLVEEDVVEQIRWRRLHPA